MKYAVALSVALAALGFFACSSDSSSPGGDAGLIDDGGVDTGVSTTRPDSAAGDTGSSSDTGATDSGSGDSAIAACTAAFAGCTEVDAGGDAAVGSAFIDFQAADAAIVFGGAAGLAYLPKCIKIKAGKKVTWNGDFTSHPLTPAPCNDASGDKITSTSTGTMTSVTFTKPGIYGYYCAIHGVPGGSAAGMNGVIVVD